MLFEYNQKVIFELTNPEGMEPDKGNVLIDLFRNKLKSLKYQTFYPDEGISGSIFSIDDLIWSQPMPHLVNLTYNICRWNVADGTENAVQNYNNRTKQRLNKIVMNIRMEIGGTVLRVIDIIHH